MILYLDENNKITGYARIGGRSENSYEVDSIPEDVLQDILNYKYIDGEFIKVDEDPRNNYIDIIREVKINMMSNTCALMINNGIDFNGDHYSLTTTDQINLMKLESVARLSPETPILYHADGEECRVYSTEEIIQIATLGIGLITFHTTYFNQLKAQIKSMTNIDDIINIKYGMQLDETRDARFKLLTNGIEFPMTEVDDTFDYETLIPKIDPEAIRAALRPIEEPETVVVPDEPIIEPWKPSTQPFVPEDGYEGDEGETDIDHDPDTPVDDSDVTEEDITDTPEEIIPDDGSDEVTDDKTPTDVESGEDAYEEENNTEPAV